LTGAGWDGVVGVVGTGCAAAAAADPNEADLG